MRYSKVPKGLVEETKAIIRLYQFLRYECGLRCADKLSSRDLKHLLNALKVKDKGCIFL